MRFRLPLASVIAVVWLGTVATQAQDFAFSGPQWLFPDDPPDTLPVSERLRRPEIAPELRELDQIHYAEFRLHVSAEDTWSLVEHSASMPWLPLTTLSFGRVQSARRDGNPVASYVVLHLIYNPESAREGASRSSPRLRAIVPPEHPELAPDEKRIARMLRVAVDVDATGRVVAAEPLDDPEPPFAAAARFAVRQWQFDPAQPDGVPVAARTVVPVIFLPTASFELARVQVPPRPVSQQRPDYPLPMRRAGIEGEVLVVFDVTPEGRVRNAWVARSNHPGFDEAAIEAVEAWRFTPGVVDGRPVYTRISVPMVFRIQGDGEVGFRIRRPRKFSPETPEAMQFERPPELKNYVVPSYPREALLADEGAKVTVGFLIGPDGLVHRAEPIGEAPAALAAAAVAAVEGFAFRPGSRAGEPCYAGVRIEFQFRPNGTGDVPVTAEDRRILRLLEKSPEKVVPLAELDAVPKPRSRRPPFPPLIARDQPAGEANVEFVIDRKGFARLPRLIDASHPAFGYAAMQAISTWRFEPPRKEGRPVDALVRIPVRFGGKAAP